MKGRLLVSICLLGIVLALMTMPVSAATASVGILGSIPQAVSISVSTPAAGTLNPGSTTTWSPAITATSNTGFTITVSDMTGRASTSLGNMSSVTTSAPASYLTPATVLGTPISVVGTTQASPLVTAASAAGGMGNAINATVPQTVYTSSVPVTADSLPLTVSQPVLTADTVLPTNQEYRIDLTFTITNT
jgi:hypothetical protein